MANGNSSSTGVLLVLVLIPIPILILRADGDRTFKMGSREISSNDDWKGTFDEYQ